MGSTDVQWHPAAAVDAFRTLAEMDGSDPIGLVADVRGLEDPCSLHVTGPDAAAIDAVAILDELVETVDGVRAAILASVDGFGVARNRSMSDEASHPAMLAAAIGLAHQLVVMGGGNRLRKLVVDHDGGLMLVWPVGDQRVLAVLAAGTVDQRRVRSFVEARAAWLAEAAS
jgi:predicted regulator of Ras-like GTPase activity (Roadblock/LC7/MglB family)